MRLLVIGLAALMVGLAGGAWMSGNRLKDDLLAERAAARADSVESEAVPAAAEAGAGAGDEAGSGAGYGSAVRPSSGEAAPSFAGFDTERVVPASREDSGSVYDGSAATALPAATGDPSEADEGTAPARAEAGSPVEEEAGVGLDGETERVAETIPTGAAEAAADSAALQGAIQLARMFSAMKPADAAAVLQELTDPEVEAIMRHMQSRLAGQILGAFEPRRAALLSRVVLGGAPES